jgi:hypothetical protein
MKSPLRFFHSARSFPVAPGVKFNFLMTVLALPILACLLEAKMLLLPMMCSLVPVFVRLGGITRLTATYVMQAQPKRFESKERRAISVPFVLQPLTAVPRYSALSTSPKLPRPMTSGGSANVSSDLSTFHNPSMACRFLSKKMKTTMPINEASAIVTVTGTARLDPFPCVGMKTSIRTFVRELDTSFSENCVKATSQEVIRL